MDYQIKDYILLFTPSSVNNQTLLTEILDSTQLLIALGQNKDKHHSLVRSTLAANGRMSTYMLLDHSLVVLALAVKLMYNLQL